MLHIRLICVGKIKEAYLKQAVADYQTRLKRLCRLEICQLDEARLPDTPGAAQISAALDREATQLIAQIPRGAYVIALCIEGKQLFSPELADLFTKTAANRTGTICLIIGSSYGLAERVKQRSDLRMSLSLMTFPHQLARVLVLEQVYRALKIAAGQTYHK